MITPPLVEQLPGAQVKLSFTITPEEAQPYLDEAARALQEIKPIQGFRPGKAPYAEVAKTFGEMRVWETALERIVRASYLKALIDKNLDTVGSPEIQVEKLTPGQEIAFSAVVPVAPAIKTLADTNKVVTEYAARAVGDEELEKAVTDLRRMQRKEVRTLEPATKDHLVILDLEMKRGGVPLEGGTGRDYRVFLGEDHYLPGFSEKLIGVNEGEERTFTLQFPTEHYQKHLAGQDVDFTAKATGVFRLELPALDEAFAKTLGQESVDALKTIVRENMTEEEAERARQKCEIAMLEALVDKSVFTDIPELLVNDEVRKMLAELEHTIEERGMKMGDYLTSIKKTMDDLRMDFVPQAIRRVKTATLIKEVAKRENVTVEESEIDHDLDHILESLRPDDTQTRERVASPEYREYMGIMLRNQKTLELLKGRCIKGYVPRKAHVHGEHDHA